MYDVECPYCGAELDINHDDGYGYEEDRTHEQECDECGKTFTYTTATYFTYEVQKADCLNEDADHNWEVVNSYPFERQWARMRCTTCDKHRAITDEEFNAEMKRREQEK